MSELAGSLTQNFNRWLFRLHGPEASPIVLGQRRVFVLPTGSGLAFAVTVILLLIGSINYFLSLGFMLTFLLAGLGIVAIIHSFRNLVGLEIAAGRCGPVFRGESAVYTLAIRNHRPDARLALRLRVGGGAPAALDVPGSDSAEARLVVPTRRRGWQRLQRITLETTFPLGLIRAWSYIQPDMRCLVYPAPERDPPPLPFGAAGLDGMLRAGPGIDDFAGLRGHQPADSPRHIAWKAVAREAPLLTKQFAGAAAGLLWLDWWALPTHLDTEARLSRLTAWVLAAHGACLPFGLRLPGVELAPADDEAHVRRCLQELALHDCGER
jgi:uncharacterized protein (DUF58 family)